MKQPATLTLYERLGGKPAIEAAVQIFYKKVIADKNLNPFFKETDMKKQMGKQTLFMTYAFGGAPKYTGKSMKEAHQKAREMGLNEAHFNGVAGHLMETLRELNVPEPTIEEVISIVATTKDDILNKA